MNRLGLIGGALALLCTLGCGGASATHGYLSRPIDAPDVSIVLDEGERILRREFGRVTVNRAAARLVSEPVEFNTSRESGSTRDLYGGPSRLRRSATLTAVPSGARVLARVRVEVEREDTLGHEAFGQESYRLSDTPGYTPIERDAARTERQNKRWTFVRRDLALEREILTELVERFAAQATSQAAAPGGPAPSTAAAGTPAPE